uniref:Influenza virus NS1A-binding protein-like n=1 Tax=Phallusia mammillata TaxID=59560 RepID=A0A6F9DFG4_9ASCI|nr:influenza virus NS1A-binding protein-like [Phallusia mammillata]
MTSSENNTTVLNSTSEIVPKDFENNIIADGGFGTVYTKEHPEYGNIVVKRFRLRNVSKEVRCRSENDVEREHKMLHLCDHPNILKCFETRTLSTGSIELMLEQAGGGNLQDLVLKYEELAWDDRFHIAMGLAKGLSYLHSMSVVHGDIKPQNVLLTESKEVKIGDFGAARILEIPSASWESINRKQKDQKTNFYCAPELYKAHQNEDGTKVKIIRDYPMDVYSYAMVLYEVITKKEMYKDAERHPLIIQNAILRGERPNLAPLTDIMDSLQPESKDFEILQLLCNIMKQCWDADPLKRLTMDEGANWFTAVQIWCHIRKSNLQIFLLIFFMHFVWTFLFSGRFTSGHVSLFSRVFRLPLQYGFAFIKYVDFFRLFKSFINKGQNQYKTVEAKQCSSTP